MQAWMLAVCLIPLQDAGAGSSSEASGYSPIFPGQLAEFLESQILRSQKYRLLLSVFGVLFSWEKIAIDLVLFVCF